MKFPSKEEIDYLKKRYLGKTIRIISTTDPYGSGYAGRTGKVNHVDDAGTLRGTWGGLGMIPGEDSFEIIEENGNG